MVPTLNSGDLLLVLDYSRSPLFHLDDIVVAHPREHRSLIIKRVVGLPGDSVDCGVDQILDEIANSQPADDDPKASRQVAVPEAHYFLAGDNPESAFDSRLFGPVPSEEILGRALFRLWPRTGRIQ